MKYNAKFSIGSVRNAQKGKGIPAAFEGELPKGKYDIHSELKVP